MAAYKIEIAGEGAAHAIAHGLVFAEVTGTRHGFVQAQLHLLVVDRLGLAPEHEAQADLALPGVIGGEIEGQVVLIGDRLPLQGKESGAQGARP